MNARALPPFEIVAGEWPGKWTAQRVNGQYHASDSAALGLCRMGELVAGVIYENWNRRSITCHIAIEGCVTRAFLHKICDYPFSQLGAEKVIAVVAEGNAKSLRFVRHFGFIEEARIAGAHPTGALIVMTMTRQQCRFVEN